MLSSLWGRITGKDKGKQFPEQQGESLGRVGDWAIVYPYGFYADAPAGTLFAKFDDGANMPVTESRPKDGEPGEPMLFHPKTGARIIMRNDGSIDVLPADGQAVNLGSGGEGIAREGDEVEITVPIGAFTDTNPVSGGDTSPLVIVTLTGTITSSGGNTST